jgi:hypothetical protein
VTVVDGADLGLAEAVDVVWAGRVARCDAVVVAGTRAACVAVPTSGLLLAGVGRPCCVTVFVTVVGDEPPQPATAASEANVIAPEMIVRRARRKVCDCIGLPHGLVKVTSTQ